MERDNVISWTGDKDPVFLNETKTSILFDATRFLCLSRSINWKKKRWNSLAFKEQPARLGDIGGCLYCYSKNYDFPFSIKKVLYAAFIIQ